MRWRPTGALARRLPGHRRAQHDSTVAALSAAGSRGGAGGGGGAARGGGIGRFARALLPERGLRDGALALIPVERPVARQAHGPLRTRESFEPGEG
ncbi:MAG: hypothetical protein ACXIUV_00575 [Alkalilacustris sp.]